MSIKLPLILLLLIYQLFFSISALTASSDDPTTEEQAVFNLNQGILPNEASGNFNKEEEGLFKIFLKKLSSWGQGIRRLFRQEPNYPGTLLMQSGGLHQSQLPPELVPKEEELLDKLKGFLGGSTGFYGVNLPDFSKELDEKEPYVTSYGEFYEQANFPEGVKPITK